MSSWEHIFKSKGRVFEKPQQELVDVFSKIKDKGVSKVLDLGCGSGRHTVYLAKEGLEVFATDVTDTGLQMTKDWLKDEKLNAELIKASCFEKFPFEDNTFDFVVSTRVIYHNYHDKVLFCISEIKRVLKTDGYVFLMVPDQRYKNRDLILKQVESHTYLPETGDEIGVPHVIYDDALVLSDFKDFDIIESKHSGEDHFCLLLKRKQL